MLQKHTETAAGIGLNEKTPAKRTINENQSTSLKRIKIEVDLNKLYRGVVKFVAGKSVSFRALEDEGFKMITEDLFQAAGITVNRRITVYRKE